MNRNTAAEKFAEMLLNMGVKESINTLFDAMSHPTGTRKQQWTDVQAWYESRTQEDKDSIRFLIKEATVFSAVGIAAFLDGIVRYVDAEGKPAEFAVALQIYQDYDAASKKDYTEVIPICPTQRGEDVHDILLSLLDDINVEKI